MLEEEFRTKENERIEAIQKQRHQDNIEASRQKCKESSQRYREKKKLEKANSSKKKQGGFTSPQAYGKAVKRVMRALPSSPSKAKIAVQGVAPHVGLDLHKKMQTNIRSQKALSEETENLVKLFYYRMDVVYTMPGLNDYMTIWEGGERKRVRKHFLTMYLKECYSLFKKLYPEEEVSFSKFASLRPANVLLLNATPRDQCKCKLHENFRMKLKALNVNYDGEEFWGTYLCESDELQNECWRNDCVNCQSGKLFFIEHEKDLDSTLVWKEWVKDENDKVRVAMKEGCKGELLEDLRESFTQFKEHVRVKRIQANAFEKDKASPEYSVLQFDYAMAFSCEYQNEIQSGLWSRASVNLFTAAMYCRDKKCESFCLASQSSDKGKCATYTYLMKLIETIKDKDLGNCLVLYSDGPSEFKNKFLQRILLDIGKRLKINVSWKFFATSHGKGVVDGIGGSAKACVRARIMSKDEKVVVQKLFISDFVKRSK